MLKRVMTNYIKFIVAILIFSVIGIILIFKYSWNQLLTNDEINTIISERQIEPTLITDIGDSYTVIVYNEVENNERLAIIVYKNKLDKIKTKVYSFYKSSRMDKVDVEYWSIEPYDYNLIGYVGIEILNKDILEEARSVEVVLDNGLVIRSSVSDSNIILLPASRKYFWEKPKLEKVVIYNKKGDIIHGFN